MNKILNIITISFLVIACNTVQEEKNKVELPNTTPVLIQEITSSKFLESIEEIDKSIDSMSLRYGTSFGQCVEYCKTEIKITSVGIKHTKSAWNIREDLPKLPPITKVIPFSKNDWKILIEKIDFDKFKKLEDRIGCPDCNDGGAEWVEIGYNGRMKTVTIEYGASIEELNELLKPIRKLK